VNEYAGKKCHPMQNTETGDLAMLLYDANSKPTVAEGWRLIAWATAVELSHKP
jgi:hypothetical protein